jgi:hypothetical protein
VVLGIELHKQRVYLIAQASSLGEGGVTFGRQEVQYRGLVFGLDGWESRRFLTNKKSDRASVEAIGLPGPTGATTT